MSRNFPNSGRLGVPELDSVSNTPLVPLGTVVSGYLDDGVKRREGEFIYVQFAATTTVGQACKFDHTAKASLADSDTDTVSGASIGAAVAASAAADHYGFLQVSGTTKVKAGDVAAAGKVFISATGGQLDDAAVNGGQVIGATFETIEDANGFAYATFDRPAIQSAPAS